MPDNAGVIDGKDIPAQWRVHVDRCAGAARDRPDSGRRCRSIRIAPESGLIYCLGRLPRMTLSDW